MTYAGPSASQGIESQLRAFTPFESLPAELGPSLDGLLEPCRFRMGQTLLRPDVLPDAILLIREGQIRSLGPEPGGRALRTIERLGPGSVLGWAGLLRGQPCEHLRASTEVEALRLPAAPFRDLLAGYPTLSSWFQNQLSAAELHTLLIALAARDPQQRLLLEQWPAPLETARVRSLVPGLETALGLPPGFLWFASSGLPLAEAWTERPLAPLPPGAPWLRLVGLPDASAPAIGAPTPAAAVASGALQPPTVLAHEIPDAGDYSPSPPPPAIRRQGGGGELVLARASGPRDIPIAICRALADYFGLPLNRDALIDQVEAILQRQERLNLVNIGQIMDALGLRVVLTRVPADRLARVPTPAVLVQNGHIGVLDGIDPDGQARLLEAELGPLRVPCSELVTHEGGVTELLLFERKPDAKQARFNWGWYAPFIREHRREFVEVGVASLVINLLELVVPLGLMVLIDQGVRSRSIGAVLSIGAVMVLGSLVAALLKTLRSFIFTEAANRIDQEAKGTILDHLVRLPQGFFDSRPVGRVTFYFSQLDRLREFLVGRSIPTFIDFLFTPIFVAVLLAFSPLLTLISLSTLPLVIGLALLANPMVDSQIKRTMAEAVNTSSYLTESITGIQTIKSQNAELKTRWEFQNRYARFIGEDFKLRITKETLTNLAGFIGNLNEVLVIGFGIWLVIQGEVSIGVLIAFRILGSKITRPIVQLVDTWQQFKQSSQQLEMVADVVDRSTEQTLEEAQNIPMPPIHGRVQFVDLSFRFGEQGPLTLDAINLEIPSGAFVGVVGSSGSGKSTLLKLLPRFYRPLEGKVLIDGLDINKVELYSLRRQIGVVPQDSLLFDGTVRENLLLVKPDATAAEMIRAARIACAHDFIMAMPKGYNSDVGERGAGLSGGQRQRLALARAVLQNPRMLILDEATSALDANTERQLCINLFEAFRGRTVFFITHRLSTVRPADTIVLMDKGAIMEMGSHHDLMRQQGWYYALFMSQSQEGIS
jgi:ATP-binding cassette subfamily B protein